MGESGEDEESERAAKRIDCRRDHFSLARREIGLLETWKRFARRVLVLPICI